VLAGLRGRSLAFQNHYTTATNTYDAHYSLFRSMYVQGEVLDGRALYGGPSRDPSIVDVFHRAGYAVGMFHGSFLRFIDTRWVWEARAADPIVDAQAVVSPDHPGWSWGATDDDLVGSATGWIDGLAGKPFLLVHNPAGSHHPYYSSSPPAFPGKSCSNRYRSALRTTDTAVARLLSFLHQRGLEENTVIAVVSDHGETVDDAANVCGHGIANNEPELHVPFFLYHPRWSSAGVVEASPTNHLDVAPTLAALAGIEAPRRWLGRNLFAVRVDARPLFVGLSYRRHLALIVGDAAADMNALGGRTEWYRVGESLGPHASLFKPDVSVLTPELRSGYERTLASFEDRVELHHLEAAFGGGTPGDEELPGPR
jgi:hypothetical protein